MKSYRLCDLSEERIADLCQRNPGSDPSLMRTCQDIFQRVESQGDEAIREYTHRFDGVDISQFRVSAQEFSVATAKLPVRSRKALEHAARNIRKFHAAQQVDEKPVQVESGVCCWRESRAIDSVGLYIPGGERGSSLHGTHAGYSGSAGWLQEGGSVRSPEAGLQCGGRGAGGGPDRWN